MSWSYLHEADLRVLNVFSVLYSLFRISLCLSLEALYANLAVSYKMSSWSYSRNQSLSIYKQASFLSPSFLQNFYFIPSKCLRYCQVKEKSYVIPALCWVKETLQISNNLTLLGIIISFIPIAFIGALSNMQFSSFICQSLSVF